MKLKCECDVERFIGLFSRVLVLFSDLKAIIDECLTKTLNNI